MAPTDEDNQDERSRQLIEGGSELAGAAAGGALGLLGGPAAAIGGAALGVAVTRTLKRVGGEIQGRWLGDRQRVRVGAAYAVAADQIEQRIEAGQQPRDDGFFDEGDSGRVDAEELLEGVLLHAADAYEERKVVFLGRLYAGIAFESRISAGYGHFLAKLADRLTYRQLAALAFAANDEYEARRSEIDVARSEGTTRSSQEIVAELDELGAAGLVGVEQEGGRVANPRTTVGAGTFSELPLVRMKLTPLGSDLHELMGLSSVPDGDQEVVTEELQGSGT